MTGVLASPHVTSMFNDNGKNNNCGCSIAVVERRNTYPKNESLPNHKYNEERHKKNDANHVSVSILTEASEGMKNSP